MLALISLPFLGFLIVAGISVFIIYKHGLKSGWTWTIVPGLLIVYFVALSFLKLVKIIIFLFVIGAIAYGIHQIRSSSFFVKVSGNGEKK